MIPTRDGRLGAHGRGQINYGKYCGVCVTGMIERGQKSTLVKKSFGLLTRPWAKLFKAGLRYSGLVRNLNSDMKAEKENSVLLFCLQFDDWML